MSSDRGDDDAPVAELTDYETLDFDRRHVVLADGSTLPIVMMTDDEDEPTEDVDEAEVLLVGSTASGYFEIFLEGITRVTFH